MTSDQGRGGQSAKSHPSHVQESSILMVTMIFQGNSSPTSRNPARWDPCPWWGSPHGPISPSSQFPGAHYLGGDSGILENQLMSSAAGPSSPRDLGTWHQQSVLRGSGRGGLPHVCGHWAASPEGRQVLSPLLPVEARHARTPLWSADLVFFLARPQRRGPGQSLGEAIRRVAGVAACPLPWVRVSP